MIRSLIFLLVAAASLAAASAAAVDFDAHARASSVLLTQDDEPKVEKSKVRYGSLQDVDLTKDKVGVVNSRKVYLQIPAYKTILDEKVVEGSARYIKLMEEATRVYREKLKAAAIDKGLKLVVEVGGVSGVRTSDLTDAIIESL